GCLGRGLKSVGKLEFREGLSCVLKAHVGHAGQQVRRSHSRLELAGFAQAGDSRFAVPIEVQSKTQVMMDARNSRRELCQNRPVPFRGFAELLRCLSLLGCCKMKLDKRPVGLTERRGRLGEYPSAA